MQGQREALEALNLAGEVGETWGRGRSVELQIPTRTGASAIGMASETDAAPAPFTRSLARGGSSALPEHGRILGSHPHTHSERSFALDERASKAALAAFGVRVPRSRVVALSDVAAAAQDIGFPVVIKATGSHLEHKSEVGGVIVNVRTTADALAAAERLAKLSDYLMVEEMVSDGVAEILVGMTVDPQFGQVLVLGAGGVLAELLQDTVTLLPPFEAEGIETALARLKISKLLAGFRGKPAGDIPALVANVLACTRYAGANLDSLLELDINPVIVRPAGLGAVAVDALIRLAEP
jgi:acetyl-CoA synthetase